MRWNRSAAPGKIVEDAAHARRPFGGLERGMQNRRDFLRTAAGATAGMMLTGGAFASPLMQGGAAAPGKRREVSIGGHRVKVVDVHAHCQIPEVWELVKNTKLPTVVNGPPRGQMIMGPERIQWLDDHGIDVQVLTINPYWYYGADRELATKLVRLQDDKLAEWCASHPDRYAGMSAVALQFPDLAAEQLEYAVKNLKMRGASIGGHVEGEPLSSPRFDPFWAKAQELGVVVFMHPQGAENIIKKGALDGRGDLGNIIGNPLETTLFLSHMIFDGALDRFPNLKICAAHGGGYLASYLGRTEVACQVRPKSDCENKKHPSEYMKTQVLVDTIILTEEGLRHLVAEVGSGQVVFGTDEPFNWQSNVDLILNSPSLNDSQKEAILGGTLVKMLRI
jgi:aminocarboxymuconate-semialdehyde decarboxylase